MTNLSKLIPALAGSILLIFLTINLSASFDFTADYALIFNAQSDLHELYQYNGLIYLLSNVLDASSKGFYSLVFLLNTALIFASFVILNQSVKKWSVGAKFIFNLVFLSAASPLASGFLITNAALAVFSISLYLHLLLREKWKLLPLAILIPGFFMGGYQLLVILLFATFTLYIIHRKYKHLIYLLAMAALLVVRLQQDGSHSPDEISWLNNGISQLPLTLYFGLVAALILSLRKSFLKSAAWFSTFALLCAVFLGISPSPRNYGLAWTLPLIALSCAAAYEFIGQIGSNTLRRNVSLGMIALFCLPGFYSLFAFPSQAYYQGDRLLHDQAHLYRNYRLDPLLLAPYSFYMAYAEDTLQSNLPSGIPYFDNHLIYNSFRNRNKLKLEGYFQRLTLDSALRKSISFPPKNSRSVLLVNDLSTAAFTRPIPEIDSFQKMIYAGKLGDAIVGLKKLSDSLDNEPDIIYLLAEAQYRFSYWDDALKNLERLKSLDELHPELRILEGSILQKKNQLTEARLKWKKAIQFAGEPAKGRILWLLANSYWRVQNVDSASYILELAMEYEGPWRERLDKLEMAMERVANAPQSGINTFNRAWIDSVNQAGENGDTIRLKLLRQRMQQYLLLDSANAVMRAHVGLSNFILGQFDLASIHFEASLELNPNYSQVRDYLVLSRINWGAREFEKDSFEAAIFHFQYALDYDPENQLAMQNLASAHLKLADQYMEKELYNEAYAHIRHILGMLPSYPPALVSMGKFQLLQNEVDSAEIAYYTAYQQLPKDEEVLKGLIEVYTLEGDAYKVQLYEKRLREIRQEP